MSAVPQPIPTVILAPDGLHPTPYRVASLPEAVPYEPPGVYTVARTFHGDRALLFSAHLDRLEQSARLAGIPLRLDRERLRAAMHEVLHRSGYVDAKFRITVPQDDPARLYLAFEPFRPVPENVLREGTHVISVPLVRANPIVKTTDWMVIRRPAYDSLPPDVYEGILVREDGALLEGLSSNFYAVLEGTLYTAGEGVLEGITRRAILEIAPSILPVALQAPRLADAGRFSEALLTSSGRGVVPITRINGQPVGDGRVGPLVTHLMHAYGDWAEAHLEPI